MIANLPLNVVDRLLTASQLCKSLSMNLLWETPKLEPTSKTPCGGRTYSLPRSKRPRANHVTPLSEIVGSRSGADESAPMYMEESE